VTPAQRLTLIMLSDLLDGLKIETTVNTPLLRKAVLQGHFWALDWEMPFLRTCDDRHCVVNEVVEALQLFTVLEASFSALPQADKDEMRRLAEPSFHGFCPATEAQHHDVARFLILDMGRFPAFRDRNLESPEPTLERTRTLLRKFRRRSNQPLSIAQSLSAAELRDVLAGP
jgi:uncharacterized protein YfbU (UPF0304 family)